ncbi:DUF1295 domain-containing protein [bacterium]|nr:DUF1295 domain-containing protein [bacterium]
MSNNFFFPNLDLSYHDYSFFWINILMMFLVFILLFIYSSASVSLGFKASNLTNRGIVKNKTYSLIRHPAYSTKVLMWWFMIIPIINLQILFSMLVLSFVYYMRAITEERHLSQDPDYLEYCKKVKSRFIPGIW